jgi:OFA family oxalate/formate antiporter-like MFS transporter
MDNFGPKFQGVNYGIVFIGYSTSAFVAPKVTAGIAAANNGDFTKAFYVAIVVAAAGLILDLVYKKKTATKAITETAQ